jgi:hypothetical protein
MSDNEKHIDRFKQEVAELRNWLVDVPGKGASTVVLIEGRSEMSRIISLLTEKSY